MTKQERKNFDELQNIVSWLLEYAEYDEVLSDGEDERKYSFPNVVISITESEKKNLEKIINF